MYKLDTCLKHIWTDYLVTVACQLTDILDVVFTNPWQMYHQVCLWADTG